ncbi:Hypothetical protein CINCED_3A023236, partial [Cinara cedri]
METTDRESPGSGSGHGWAAGPPSARMDTSWTAETAADIVVGGGGGGGGDGGGGYGTSAS